jgi:hypothetical protein
VVHGQSYKYSTFETFQDILTAEFTFSDFAEGKDEKKNFEILDQKKDGYMVSDDNCLDVEFINFSSAFFPPQATFENFISRTWVSKWELTMTKTTR